MNAEKSVKVIENELKTFDKKLFAKPRIIVVNKMDLPEAQKAYETIKKKFKKHKVMLMSAATGEGVNKVLDEVVKILAATPVEPPAETKQSAVTHRVEPIFSIFRDEEDVINIRGKKFDEVI